MRAFVRVLHLSLCLAVLPTAAWPQTDHGTFSLQIENDRVAATDRHYTHGTRLGWVSPRGQPPAWSQTLFDEIFVDVKGERRLGFSLGQSIFTPDDTESIAVVDDDRPYAGWLYGGMELIVEDADDFRRVALDLGIVGPSAKAEQTQNEFHELIGVSRSNGWDNQLNDELGFALFAERKWRDASRFPFAGVNGDVTWNLGGSLGNVLTYAAAGVALRVGNQLDSDFGPPRIRPSLSGSAFFDPVPFRKFGWYLFAGVELRAVGRNIFLDGNTISDSHDVSKKPVVGDFQAGLALFYGRARLTYTGVFRTKEFDGQPEADRFGAISLSFTF